MRRQFSQISYMVLMIHVGNCVFRVSYHYNSSILIVNVTRYRETILPSRICFKSRKLTDSLLYKIQILQNDCLLTIIDIILVVE